jgi:hypothetical protein
MRRPISTADLEKESEQALRLSSALSVLAADHERQDDTCMQLTLEMLEDIAFHLHETLSVLVRERTAAEQAEEIAKSETNGVQQ